MFKVNHKDTRTISFTSLWCLLMVTFEHISHFFLVLFILTFDRHMFGGEVFEVQNLFVEISNSFYLLQIFTKSCISS